MSPRRTINRTHPLFQVYAKAIELQPSDGTLQKNFDTTEMLVKVELMLKELDTMEGEYWDLEGFGNGKNYSDKTEVTVRFALERHPEYTTKVIRFLKDAVKKQPKFAIMSHILANTLVFASKGAARGTPDEKKMIADAKLAMSNSINLSYETRTRVQEGASDCQRARTCVYTFKWNPQASVSSTAQASRAPAPMAPSPLRFGWWPWQRPNGPN